MTVLSVLCLINVSLPDVAQPAVSFVEMVDARLRMNNYNKNNYNQVPKNQFAKNQGYKDRNGKLGESDREDEFLDDVNNNMFGDHFGDELQAYNQNGIDDYNQNEIDDGLHEELKEELKVHKADVLNGDRNQNLYGGGNQNLPSPRSSGSFRSPVLKLEEKLEDPQNIRAFANSVLSSQLQSIHLSSSRSQDLKEEQPV
jgi:hypothetical protein